MWAYLLRRTLLMIPTLFGVTLVTFCVMSFAPGDPIKSSTGGEGMSADRPDRENYRIRKREFALDKPRCSPRPRKSASPNSRR